MIKKFFDILFTFVIIAIKFFLQSVFVAWLVVLFVEPYDFEFYFKWMTRLYYSAWYGAVASYVCLWLKYAQTKRVWIYRLLFLMLFCGFNAVMLFIVRM